MNDLRQGIVRSGCWEGVGCPMWLHIFLVESEINAPMFIAKNVNMLYWVPNKSERNLRISSFTFPLNKHL